MPGVSGERGSSESHDAKGIQLKKSNCPDVLLKWNQVAERIDGLIQMKSRHFTRRKRYRIQHETRITPPITALRLRILMKLYCFRLATSLNCMMRMHGRLRKILD